MEQAQRTIRVLVIQGEGDDPPALLDHLGHEVEVVRSASPSEAQAQLADEAFDYVLAAPALLNDLPSLTASPSGVDLLETVSQGVGIVNSRGEFDWANPRLLGYPQDLRAFVGQVCSRAFAEAGRRDAAGVPSQLSGQRSMFTGADGGLYDVTATPITDEQNRVVQIVAVVWDVTRARKRQEQLVAIDRAGRELVRLETEQVSRLDTQERLALLEQKIVRYLSELMHFDNFSIRVFDKETNRLELVLSWGLKKDTQPVDLYALPHGNGICGYVAFHSRSYICPDVSRDPRYYQGTEGARSSLTVPLRYNDEVIGVLNVDSKNLAAFDEESRQLAERFGRDIAVALHILDLLVTERYTTTGKLGSDVMAEISGPVNDILTDVENLVEDYIGHDDLRHRLNRITNSAVTIRKSIKRVTSPKRGVMGAPTSGLRRQDPILDGKRILIADDESLIRDTVRDVLVSYGCAVSVADDGNQALILLSTQPFDLVLTDIRMPGKDGYAVFAAAKDADPTTPVILMTGFGYDPNHSIVRARREGLAAVLFKPFKVDQLLGEIRTALRHAAGG